MIQFRIDVDYPYPSRVRSFMYTALGIEIGQDYLKNSKIIAKMINKSPKKVKAYWFFTPKTIPDKELMRLIDNEKHEVALHVVNDPYAELRTLEQITGKRVNYYTIHGTARLLARIMWRRWRTKAPKIPDSFPLKSFHELPTEGLDSLCYRYPPAQALEIAKDRIREGYGPYFHPIWLFQRGKMNHRGPFYWPLKEILEVDNDLDYLDSRKKMFFSLAKDTREYLKDVVPTEEFVQKLGERGMDVFTFLERSWTHKISNPQSSWAKMIDNVGLLHVTDYGEWLKSVGKKTRNMIRKAEKSEIRVELAQPKERLAEGIWHIYNETPIRQGRGFSHYGERLESVKKMVFSIPDCSYIGAYLQDELVGFVQLVHGDNIVMISQILSLQKHWDKGINNALVAKAVEASAGKHEGWMMYGRMGNHPSLDNFKRSNGFTRYQLIRYYVPATRRGRLAIKLGLHKEIKDSLPSAIKTPLFPVYSWVSRTKAKLKLRPKLLV